MFANGEGISLPCPFIVVKPTDGNDKGDTGSIGQEYTGSNNNEDDDCETCCADCQGDDTLAGESKGVSINAIKEIHDRTHGKPLQTTELHANIDAKAEYKLPDGTVIEV